MPLKFRFTGRVSCFQGGPENSHVWRGDIFWAARLIPVDDFSGGSLGNMHSIPQTFHHPCTSWGGEGAQTPLSRHPRAQDLQTSPPGKNCCYSVAKLCLTLCCLLDCRLPGLPVLHCLLEFGQTHVLWVSDAIQPSHPLSPPSPPVFNLSQHQGLFQWVSSLHQLVKVLEIQLQHQSFHEYSGLIAFRMDWMDLLAVQGTLKSLLQHQNSKISILQCSVFFMVQLSHTYITTGKIISWTIHTFVSRLMSLLFNTLSRFVIAFLPRSKLFFFSFHGCSHFPQWFWNPRK